MGGWVSLVGWVGCLVLVPRPPPPPLLSKGVVSAPGIFFDPCCTGDLLGGALSAARAHCNYLDV